MAGSPKTIWVLLEGAHDEPQDALEGRTPLQVARCPAASKLVEGGQCGWLLPPKDGWRVETLAGVLSGLSPLDAARLQRGPLEAAAAGVDVGSYDYIYSGEFVTLDQGILHEPRVDRLRPEEAAVLVEAVQAAFDPHLIRFLHLDGSHLVALAASHHESLAAGTPPWEIEGEDASAALATGRPGEVIRRVFEKSGSLLEKHAINDVRVDLGENPATHVWLWGGGRTIRPSLARNGAARRGVMLAGSGIATGFARCAGMDVVPLRDPWAAESGPVFAADALLRAAQEADVVGVHAAPPREGGRYGSPVEKVRLLERFDVQVIRPLAAMMPQLGPCRLALVSATRGRAPWVLAGEGVPGGGGRWEESAFEAGGLGAVPPDRVFEALTGPRAG